MAVDEEDRELACEIIHKMQRAKILGSHHKQGQTIAGWWPSHEQGRVKSVLDDLVADPEAPVQHYRSNTYQLSSYHQADRYLDRYGYERW